MINQSSRRPRWLAGTLAIFLAFSIGMTSIHAKTAEELESEQQQIQQQKEAKLIELELKRQASDTEASKLGEIQSKLDVATNEYRDLNRKVNELEEKIADTDTKLIAAEAKMKVRKEVLSKRMRDIYKKGQISYLDVLLGATDFVDFATRIQVLRRVLTNDVNLINEVLDEQKKLAALRVDLDTNRVAQTELRKRAEEQRAIIQEERNKQKAIFDKVFAEKQLTEAAYDQLEADSLRIERALRGKRGAGAGSTGSMIWPADGPVTSSYSGGRVHPVFGVVRRPTGTDIGAGYGAEIWAADGGEVIYSGWMSGYGYTVMIDHGGGTVTLYAHQSQVACSVGQQVSQGQVIGYVGSTGYSTGPHLHFEVRIDGEPTNPQDGYI